jgi:hypothetical protein
METSRSDPARAPDVGHVNHNTNTCTCEEWQAQMKPIGYVQWSLTTKGQPAVVGALAVRDGVSRLRHRGASAQPYGGPRGVTQGLCGHHEGVPAHRHTLQHH